MSTKKLTLTCPMLGAAFTLLALAACSSGPNDEDGAGVASDAIVGTIAADSPALDAVGQVYGPNVFAPGQPMLPYGSATLIAPDRLLVAIGSLAPGAEFRVGPNPASPSQTIPIVRWIRIVQSDVDTVSLRGLPGPQGAMVAYLARPVVGVTPLPIGDLSRADIGARIGVVGYGNAGGARQLGQMTLRAMPGDSAPRILYPDVGAYAADLKATWMGSFPQETILEYANHDWNARLGSDDAVIGGVTGDTAPPIGAGYLGAAMVRRIGGRPHLVGLVSQHFGIATSENVVIPRWVFRFGPAAKELVAASAGPACEGVTNWSNGRGCLYTAPTVLNGRTTVTNSANGMKGTISGTCVRGQWTDIVDTCEPAKSCPGGRYASPKGCSYAYPETLSGVSLQVNNDAPGRTGTLSGTCIDGTWRMDPSFDDTCR